MEVRWSRSRISKLGRALISTVPPPKEELNDLHELLVMYDHALDVAVANIQGHVDVQLTSRLKNTGTILEKLRRSGGGSLPNVQDLAGIRIVLDCDLVEQLRFARRVAALFVDEDRPPKIIDRRFEALRGYRAVHVVVSVDGRLVEIQIRTRLQHQWANLFEKLADIVGRGIWYGEPPQPWTVLFDLEIEKVVRAGGSSSSEISDPVSTNAHRQFEEQILQGRAALSLTIDHFEHLSEQIFACEATATFHGNAEDFEFDPPEELPSLEEAEAAREMVLDIARSLEAMFASIGELKKRYMIKFEGVKEEFFGAGSSDIDESTGSVVLDHDTLRAQLRKHVLGPDDDSSSSGDRIAGTDSDGSEG